MVGLALLPTHGSPVPRLIAVEAPCGGIIPQLGVLEDLDDFGFRIGLQQALEQQF